MTQRGSYDDDDSGSDWTSRLLKGVGSAVFFLVLELVLRSICAGSGSPGPNVVTSGDIEGRWSGTMSRSGQSTPYTASLFLSSTYGIISGTLSFESGGEISTRDMLGVYGTYKNGTLDAMVSNDLTGSTSTRTCRLNLTLRREGSQLSGTWSSLGCGSGRMELSRGR